MYTTAHVRIPRPTPAERFTELSTWNYLPNSISTVLDSQKFAEKDKNNK